MKFPTFFSATSRNFPLQNLPLPKCPNMKSPPPPLPPRYFLSSLTPAQH